MSEKKKVGLDIARSSTLVQEYQVASWERNELPTTPELTAIDEKIAKDPENAELHKERGLLLAGLGRAALSGIYSAALYRYAVAHETPEAFQGVQLQDAFQPKR